MDKEMAIKEIFIRNLNFTTPAEKIEDLFKTIVPEKEIDFVVICKDKATGTSKGSAFIKFKTKSSYDKIMKMYEDSKSKLNELNPFELDGRNLILLPALNREGIKSIKEEKEKKDEKRNKGFLYYGLSNESIEQCDLFDDITDTDKLKRERLIEIKKNNFYNNPNFHVSRTRLAIRNFEKNVDENDIKKTLTDAVSKNKDINEKYKNKKLFKQIKLLKEDDDKSKCVAFAECCDFDLGMFIIKTLSGYKIVKGKQTKKGLIIDFSLDDYRKRVQRERKLERIKQMRKERIKENKKNKTEVEKIEVSKCDDINKLIDCYHMTLSRGKKQRIKKKLKALGYTKEIPPMEKKQEEKKEEKKESYEQIKITNSKTELNKKFKEKKMLNKKRGRNLYEDEEEKKNKKKNKKNKKEAKMVKEHITNQANRKEDEDDDDELNMGKYYTKIMNNLNKKKK